MTAISGRKWRGSYQKSGPVGCLLRTLLESTDWRSTEFFLTWRGSATKQRRRSKFRLVPSMPPTSDSESGSWATPVSQPAGNTPEDFIRRKQESVARGNSMVIALTDLGLQAQAVASGTWPTPAADDSPAVGGAASRSDGRQVMLHHAAKGMWPTPRAGDGSKGTRTPEGAAKEVARNKGPDLGAMASWPTPNVPNGGRVNPPGNSLTGKAPDGSKKQIDLNAVVRASWTTPQAHDTSPGDPARMNRHGTKHGDRNLNDEAAAWTTPCADDTSLRKDKYAQGGTALSTQAVSGKTPNGSTAATASAGALNPEFVCWLQGFPAGWLNLEPSATPSSPRSSKLSGER